MHRRDYLAATSACLGIGALANMRDVPDGEKWRFEAGFIEAESTSEVAYWKGSVEANTY